VLTPKQLCCETEVDDCGVCGGNNQCDIAGAFTPGVSARRRQLLAPTELDTTVGNALNWKLSALDNIDATPNGVGGVDLLLTPLRISQAEELANNYIKPATSDSQVQYYLSTSEALFNPTVESVGKLLKCSDTVCGPGETPSMNDPDTGETCHLDCPFSTGFCPMPGSEEMGDPLVVRGQGVDVKGCGV